MPCVKRFKPKKKKNHYISMNKITHNFCNKKNN